MTSAMAVALIAGLGVGAAAASAMGTRPLLVLAALFFAAGAGAVWHIGKPIATAERESLKTP